MEYKEIKDTMGIVRVPISAYYGPQTQRALENFPVSDLKLPREFIYSLSLIKKCAAQVNKELGLLDAAIADAIMMAAREIIHGKFDDQFGVDVFQTGSGTSTNMNMNEVIAVRANEILTGSKSYKTPVHPNDHVNLGQSSNDVIPSAIHISALGQIRRRLIPALKKLQKVLSLKSREFNHIKKIGRTHLQDAVPMTLGQEFSGYACQIESGIQRVDSAAIRLATIALGGTAVGTGLNTHPEFADRVIRHLSKVTGLPFKETQNHFEAQAACDTAVEISGQLKTVAVSLIKIANDIRLLSSGPRCGLGEIQLPALQPGSSIMPGKVNPVIPEAVIQVAAQIIGNDSTITISGQAGYFELNTMLPVIAYNILQSITIMANVIDVFADKCIMNIIAKPDVCKTYMEKSLALVTHLVPHIGYDRAAAMAKAAFEAGKTIKEVALETGTFTEQELDRIFDS